MDEAERNQMKKLGRGRDRLAAEHPDLVGRIDDGLLVALAGGCIFREHPYGGGPSYWKVRTPHLYRVRLEGIPVRWSCFCPQGTNYGPVTGDFFGHPGRVCKHVAAVAICLAAGELPGRPANVLALVERVCAAGAGGLGEAVRWLPLATKVKLVRAEDWGLASLRLKLGRVESSDLARGTEKDGTQVWYIDPEAGNRYGEWVNMIREEVTRK